jgi:trimeric autotransporter adhesin
LVLSVPSSYLASLGWGQVAVSTPSPGGGQSAPLVVSIYQSVNVPATDVLYEPFTRKLYATVPASATNIAANSLVQIDPLSGTIGAPMVLGNGPNVMAETADGRFLYIGFSGNNTLGQFNLLNQTITGSYPLSAPVVGSQAAFGLAVQPGSDTTLAILYDYEDIGIFDISGGTGAFRPHSGGTGMAMAFGDSTHLYSEPSNTADVYLNRYTVDVNGLTPVDSTGLNGLAGTGFGFALGQDGLVYGDNGGIVNPITTPPSQVALLPIAPVPPASWVSGYAVMPDSAQHKAFLVGVNEAGTFTAYLERFDTTNYTNEANVELPIPNGSGGEGYQVLRWGQDGLAVRAYDPLEGNLAGYQLLLFKGPFVLPAEAQSNPVPGFSSVTPAIVAHGSGNQYLTAVGSGFIPGAVVLWNGVARTTTYIDANHLQFAVPAADVASSQTISLTVENPGSGASSGLTLTVQ